MKKSTIATLSLAARSVLVVLALGFTAFPAQAHGIWFAQRSDDLALIYGEGGDDLNAAKRLPLIRLMIRLERACVRPWKAQAPTRG